MKLIGNVYYKSITMEDPWKKYFNVTGDGEKSASLHFLSLNQTALSAMYYCAAYITLYCKSSFSLTKTHCVSLWWKL